VIDRNVVEDWIRRYEELWRTAGTDALDELFTEDASYSMAPYAEPYRGLDAIALMWEREREGADEVFTMTTEIVACEGDTAVVRVEVHYGRGEEFKDLWIARFGDDGRCVHFEEWPFSPDDT
jgi:hypothetical protein